MFSGTSMTMCKSSAEDLKDQFEWQSNRDDQHTMTRKLLEKDAKC
jgi:hypothetical protein